MDIIEAQQSQGVQTGELAEEEEEEWEQQITHGAFQSATGTLKFKDR